MILDPQHTALLVMDYQHGIVDRLDEAPLRAVAEAIAVARRRHAVVGFVRVGFTDSDVEAIPEHSPMAAAATGDRRAAMHADHPGTAVHADLDVRDDDIVVRKVRVGAFSTTDLDEQLRRAGVTTIVLAGLSTSGVVLSTVREAADRDYRIVVLADACADPEPDVHDVLVGRVFPRQAHVTTTDQLPALLGETG